MQIKNFDKKLVYFVTFFSFSGYYVGLAFVSFFGLQQFSRFYSIPIRLLTSLFMVIVIINNLRHFKYNKKNNELVYLAIFFLFWGLYFTNIFRAFNKYELRLNVLEYIFYSLNFVILPFIMFYTMSIKQYKDVIMNALMTSGFVLGIVSIYFYFDYLMLGIGRLSMIQYVDDEVQTLSPLALSYAGSLTIVLAIYKLIYYSNPFREKLFFYTTLLVSIFMFYIGASRGSVIALLVTLPLFLIFSKKKIMISILGLFFITFLGFGAIYTGSSVFTRTENIAIDIDSGSSSGSRIYLWKEAYSHFETSIFFGDRIELISGAYPHNILLEILMATGILGFVLFIIVLFRGFSLGFLLAKYDFKNLWMILYLILGVIKHMFSGALWNATLLFIPLGIIFAYIRDLRYQDEDYMSTST